MTVKIATTLTLIHNELASAGEQVQPPASPGALASLCRYATHHLGTTLPPTYVDFLSKTDGLDFNGTMLYACTQRRLPSGGILLGFREANQVFRQSDNCELVLFGETGDDVFIERTAERCWGVADRTSLHIFDRFHTFDDLLGHVLHRAYTT